MNHLTKKSISKTKAVTALVTVFSAGSLLSGCSMINVKRITYEALRTQECKINDPTGFCDRSYSLEYEEYAQIRKQFLLEEEHAENQREIDENTVVLPDTLTSQNTPIVQDAAIVQDTTIIGDNAQ